MFKVWGVGRTTYQLSDPPARAPTFLSLSVFIRKVGIKTPCLIGLQCCLATSDKVNCSSREPLITITALWAPEEMGGISCVCLCVNKAHPQVFFQRCTCSDLFACLPQPLVAIPPSSGALGERDALQTLPQHFAVYRPTARHLSCLFSSKASKGGRESSLSPFCR